VTLPGSGNVESLNVSVAAAVLIHALLALPE
jgi:tRNA G18 (ribose-2'-O)-methylase SpoU